MKYRMFTPDRAAIYHGRPNRFIVLAEFEKQISRVHCPNPGRLREILLPGRKLILEKSQNPNRKTQWTLAAARYGNFVIPLISARANGLVGNLIIPELYPGYSAKSEQTLGKSRLDWFLEKNKLKAWIEVKACTLVEKGRALFPDAPSLRAVKHIEELRFLGGGISREIIFAVHNPSARIFSPNPHTDPELCLSLGEAAASGVKIRAVSTVTDEDGWTSVENMDLAIDLQTIELARQDSGILVGIWSSLKSGSLISSREKQVRVSDFCSMKKNRNCMSPISPSIQFPLNQSFLISP